MNPNNNLTLRNKLRSVIQQLKRKLRQIKMNLQFTRSKSSKKVKIDRLSLNYLQSLLLEFKI